MNLTYTGSIHSVYKTSCLSPLLRSYQRISPGPRHMYLFRKKTSFYGEELLAPRPALKLDDYSLSAVCDFLFSIFAATFHIRDVSSIRNQRAQITVVTRPNSYGLSHTCGLKLQRFYRLCRVFCVLVLEKQLVS